jgi:hypothetical protein
MTNVKEVQLNGNTNSNWELLNLLIEIFERDTASSSQHQREHPCYRTLVAWGKQSNLDTTLFLLTRLEKVRSWTPILALFDIVDQKDHPVFPEEATGNFPMLVNIWLTWGQKFLEPQVTQSA